MIVLSLAISLLGLLMPSVAVLIGAMLISPLMMPIIGLGLGFGPTKGRPPARTRRATRSDGWRSSPGASADAIEADTAGRTLRATAAPLPGLQLAGVRALERRAGAALPGRRVLLSPPPGATALPPVPIEQGVVDGRALELAAWASQRLGRGIAVAGGTAGQRRAVAAGIVDRNGMATPARAGCGCRRWHGRETGSRRIKTGSHRRSATLGAGVP